VDQFTAGQSPYRLVLGEGVAASRAELAGGVQASIGDWPGSSSVEIPTRVVQTIRLVEAQAMGADGHALRHGFHVA
jgi:hypothetical protein